MTSKPPPWVKTSDFCNTDVNAIIEYALNMSKNVPATNYNQIQSNITSAFMHDQGRFIVIAEQSVTEWRHRMDSYNGLSLGMKICSAVFRNRCRT